MMLSVDLMVLNCLSCLLCDDLLVIIMDPSISTSEGYKPYQDGMKMDIFIKVR